MEQYHLRRRREARRIRNQSTLALLLLAILLLVSHVNPTSGHSFLAKQATPLMARPYNSVPRGGGFGRTAVAPKEGQKIEASSVLVPFPPIYRPLRRLISNSIDGAQAVDLLITGLGMLSTFAVMGCLESVFRIPLVVAPMMASAICFHAAPTPPSLKGFLAGTVGCALLSNAGHGVLATSAGKGAASAGLLLWFKALGSGVFPPTAVVPLLMLDQPHPYRWILKTWIPGHLLVYGGALLTSKARARAKHQRRIQQQAMAGGLLAGTSEEELRRIFHRFDTSGDNALDAHELKCALRVTTGLDLSLPDCQSLVNKMDKDGNGLIEFQEFLAITQERLE